MPGKALLSVRRGDGLGLDALGVRAGIVRIEIDAAVGGVRKRGAAVAEDARRPCELIAQELGARLVADRQRATDPSIMLVAIVAGWERRPARDCVRRGDGHRDPHHPDDIVLPGQPGGDVDAVVGGLGIVARRQIELRPVEIDRQLTVSGGVVSRQIDRGCSGGVHRGDDHPLLPVVEAQGAHRGGIDPVLDRVRRVVRECGVHPTARVERVLVDVVDVDVELERPDRPRSEHAERCVGVLIRDPALEVRLDLDGDLRPPVDGVVDLILAVGAALDVGVVDVVLAAVVPLIEFVRLRVMPEVVEANAP